MSQHTSNTTRLGDEALQSGPQELLAARVPTGEVTRTDTNTSLGERTKLLESFLTLYRQQGYIVLPAQSFLLAPDLLFSTGLELEQLRFGTQKSGWSFGVAPLWLDLPDRGVVEKGDRRTAEERKIYENVLGSGVLSLLQAIRPEEGISVGMMHVNRIRAGQGFANHFDGANSPTLRDTLLWYPHGSESHPLEVKTREGEWIELPASGKEILILDRDTQHMLSPRAYLESEKPRISLVVTSRAQISGE